MSKLLNFDEESNSKSQKKLVFNEFYREPLTMLEVSNELNIFRANICRYVDEWEKRGLIRFVVKRKCTISGYPFVGAYTTNPEYFPEDNQLTFDFII